MKQRSILWQAAGFAAATFGGTILHFLYDWTGGSILVSPFSGANESTWEHMKLLYWPLFFIALIQRRFFREQENFWCIKLAQILLGLTLIPVLFYTYWRIRAVPGLDQHCHFLHHLSSGLSIRAVGLQTGSQLQIPTARLRRHLPHRCTVHRVHLRTAPDPPVPGSAHGHIRNTF